MKKMIPVITAIVLMIVVVAISIGGRILDKYSYSKERADLQEYFDISSEDEAAVILGNERIAEKARLMDGVYYFDIDTVHKYLNDRFYEDENEQLLLYTLPDETIRAEIGASSYTAEEGMVDAGYVIARYGSAQEGTGNVLYIAAEYVRLFEDYSFEVFTEPNRIQVYTKENSGEGKQAQILKDTQVRYQGGVKSPILTEAAAGDEVTVLEEMENWSKVRTEDAFIGYVENNKLEMDTAAAVVVEAQPEEEIHSKYMNPVFTSLTRPYKINMGWHAVAGEAGNDTLMDVVGGTKGLNVISPTWFALTDSNGNFSSFASKEYVNQAHDMGMEVWALIDNFTNKDAVDTYEVLAYTSRRAYLIENLVGTALEYGIDGINVDFEGISQDAGEHFVQFIRELSVACHAQGIVLSVDNYVPTGYTDHYDRSEQGVFADYVVIMGYDEHYSGSPEAGSVASISFVEDGIRKTVEEVPAQKVLNALPFYTRIWKSEGTLLSSEAVGMEAAEQFVDNHDMELLWDETACQNYAEKEEQNVYYQVWLENEESIRAKLNIMQKYNIGGVAAWKLGLEKESIWDIIGAYLAQ